MFVDRETVSDVPSTTSIANVAVSEEISVQSTSAYADVEIVGVVVAVDREQFADASSTP